MCRVPGVWVITTLTYFNCCPFSLNTPNYMPPSGDQLIFISKNVNSSFFTIWTFPSFAEGWGWGLLCHSSIFPKWNGDVGCPPPCTLSTKTLLTNSWSLIRSYFPWTPSDHHFDICCGRLSGLEGLCTFQTGRMQPGRRGMPIHTLLFLNLVLPFHILLQTSKKCFPHRKALSLDERGKSLQFLKIPIDKSVNRFMTSQWLVKSTRIKIFSLPLFQYSRVPFSAYDFSMHQFLIIEQQPGSYQ